MLHATGSEPIVACSYRIHCLSRMMAGLRLRANWGRRGWERTTVENRSGSGASTGTPACDLTGLRRGIGDTGRRAWEREEAEQGNADARRPPPTPWDV